MSTEQPDPLTDTAIGAAAADETEFLDGVIRNLPTPLAWEQCSEPDDDVEDYPPTGLFAPRSEPQSWGGTWGVAAVLLACAAVVAFVIWVVGMASAVWTQSADKALSPSTVAAAAPVAPTRSAVSQIDDAFTETIDGKTVLAFQMLQNSAGNFGTAGQPLMQLQGTPEQRKEIVGKLAALGIDVGTNDQGVVTGLGFENEDAKKNWEVWWDEHSILPTVISAPKTTATAPPSSEAPTGTPIPDMSKYFTPPPPITPQSKENAFLTEIHNQGWTIPGGDSAAIDRGWWICRLLGEGQTIEQIARRGVASSPLLTMSAARQFVNTANNDLCPELVPHGQ